MSSSILKTRDFCGLALFTEFHAQSLRAEGCHNSDGGSHNGSGDGKRQPVIITE
jgi:hypothetical protein